MKRYLFLVITASLFSLQAAIASSPYTKITELESAIYATVEPAKRLQLAEQLLVLGTIGQSYDANPFATAKSGHCAVDVESCADADEKSINMRGLILSAYVLRDQGFAAAINFFEDQLSQTSGVEQDHIRMARLIYANAYYEFETFPNFPKFKPCSTLAPLQVKDMLDFSKFNTKCFSTEKDMCNYFQTEMLPMLGNIHMKMCGISAINLDIPQELTEKEIKGEMNIMINGKVHLLTSKLRDQLRTAYTNAGRLRLTPTPQFGSPQPKTGPLRNDRIYFYGNDGNYGAIWFSPEGYLDTYECAGWLVGGENKETNQSIEFKDIMEHHCRGE